MRKRLFIALATAMIACVGMLLVGCGGGQASNYDSQKIVWNNGTEDIVELTTTGDEVVWDEEKQRDVLCVYADVKNLTNKESNVKSTLNLMSFQGEKSLSYSTVGNTKESAEYYVNSEGIKALGAGDAQSIVLAFYLENDNDVTVRFSSYTVGVPVNGEKYVDVTYPIADRLSNGMKSVLEAQNAGSYTCDNYDIKVLEGWIISDSTNDSASLKNDSTSGFISLNSSSETAKVKAERAAKSFKTKVETTTIGANKWSIVTLNDKHFYLYADTSNGEGSIQVHVLASHKDADDQIKEITIK